MVVVEESWSTQSLKYPVKKMTMLKEDLDNMYQVKRIKF